MSELRNNYQKLTDEELLKRRALGSDGLSEEAHKVIEKILIESGVATPPIPSKYIDLERHKKSKSNRLSSFFGIILGVIAIIFVEGLNHLLKGSFVGIGIAIGGVIFFVLKMVKKSNKTEEQKLDDKLEQGGEGFTELMYCSVKGDIKRAKELIDYGVDVNKQDLKGTTALMYAISNNHTDMVKFLLEHGADLSLKTDKGNTALNFAEKFSSGEIADILKTHTK